MNREEVKHIQGVLLEERKPWDGDEKTINDLCDSWLTLEQRNRELEVEIARLKADKDAAYLERNQFVAVLARLFPSGKTRTAIEGWDPEWHGCVYIDLPTGQVSWHYHDSHAELFVDLPQYAASWDGHTTEEKYRRLQQLKEAPHAE